MSRSVKIIESPRDAMQGLERFIPTQAKADYINALLKVGFDAVDFGSFVSPKAIPQMKDTGEVLRKIDLSATQTKLMVLVPNGKGAEMAAQFDEITYISFPFSISPAFVKRNIGSTIEESIKTVDSLLNISERKKKQLVVYITMAFGNPYGDEWNTDIVIKWIDVLHEMGVNIICLSDILGESDVKTIAALFSTLILQFTDKIEFGFHLHTSAKHWHERVNAAFVNGCNRFDTVINGAGGCPMTGKELIPNLRTQDLLDYLKQNNIPVDINEAELDNTCRLALNIFS